MEHTSPPHPKSKFSLVFPDNLNINPSIHNSVEDFHSQSSFPSSRNLSERERDILLQKSLEILMKSGEQRTPKDLHILLKTTENFPYFQKLKEKPSTSILHSRFCRVMKFRQLKKGETLFYAGFYEFLFKFLHKINKKVTPQTVSI
jgi:hypothetical protein